MLSSYSRAHGLAATSLRYFNVGGARGRFGGEAFAGDPSHPESAEGRCRRRTNACRIFGTDYSTADGTALRDYLHVADLGRAHLLALEHSKPGVHRVINLGTGDGYTVRQVLEACRAVTGHAIPAREEARRPGDPTSLVASNRLARDVLGWQPELTLEQTVADAWRFMQEAGVEP